MTAIPIPPIGALSGAAAPLAAGLAPPMAPTIAPAAPGGFSRLLLDGVDQVNRKVLDGETMVKAFALDDSIPLHQVTFALEQARLSTELMMQVRGRLLEGYQELMRTQL
jgi:flagellar hook-basal body complex protein FliE